MNQNLISTVLTPAAAPCPGWCALPADHANATEPDVDGTLYIRHMGPVLAEAGGRTVDLEQIDVVMADGQVEPGTTGVVLDGDGLRPFEVEQARHLAAALALAAELATGGVR